jgi:hypothetical protein
VRGDVTTAKFVQQVAAVIAVVAAGLAMPASRALADSDPPGTTTSVVGGGWATSPCVFTSFDPSTGDVTCVGSSAWTGSWTGITHYDVTGNLDLVTGDFRGTLIETFTGMYVPDKSIGTLTFVESFSIDGTNFAINIETDIVNSSGDPTFRCSTGHVTFDGFAPLVTGFGGYRGTWVHGCP